jgi:hypothetical protein
MGDTPEQANPLPFCDATIDILQPSDKLSLYFIPASSKMAT